MQMKKYRIIEVKIPELESTNGCYDFVPEILYRREFHIHICESTFWGLIKNWHLYRITNSLKAAERHIEFLQEKETKKIIKEY